MRKRTKAGRPAFKPTASLRRKVSIAAGAGMSHENIALAIGISKPTLEKYFEQELSVGASRRRMELLESLHKAGRDGSVSAAKAYLALEPRVAAPPEEPQPDPAGVPVGKKAKAKAEAVTAAEGSEWQNLLKPAATVQ